MPHQKAVTKCHDVPKKVCKKAPKETCHKVAVQVPKKVKKEICEKVKSVEIVKKPVYGHGHGHH